MQHTHFGPGRVQKHERGRRSIDDVNESASRGNGRSITQLHTACSRHRRRPASGAERVDRRKRDIDSGDSSLAAQFGVQGTGTDQPATKYRRNKDFRPPET
jgi:hypothetical protein